MGRKPAAGTASEKRPRQEGGSGASLVAKANLATAVAESPAWHAT